MQRLQKILIKKLKIYVAHLTSTQVESWIELWEKMNPTFWLCIKQGTLTKHLAKYLLSTYLVCTTSKTKWSVPVGDQYSQSSCVSSSTLYWRYKSKEAQLQQQQKPHPEKVPTLHDSVSAICHAPHTGDSLVGDWSLRSLKWWMTQWLLYVFSGKFKKS